jgi:nucleoside triphosphatase
MVMANQQYPEPTVGALIFDSEGHLLLIRSHKWHDKYVVPGGHIELGERIEEALTREVKEETGLDVYDVEFLCIQEFIYDDNFWERKHFIFFDYVCKTDSKNVTLNDEAFDFIWVSVQEALELPIDPYTKVAIEKFIALKRK